MQDMFYMLHRGLELMVEFAILFFEYIGIIVILIAGVKGLIGYIRRDSQIRLTLAKGLAMGLEFKLGSEILRTVLIHEPSEIIIVGGVIVLRTALIMLIHWEIKEEKHSLKGAEEEKLSGIKQGISGIYKGLTKSDDENKKDV